MPATQPQTTAALTQFKLGDTMQEVYLIESRLDERVWAKMWVDRSGGILRVETSLGLEMLSDTANVTQKTAAAPRKIKPAPRQEIPPHDPH